MRNQALLVFTRDDGKPVRDFRKSWHAICERARVPGLMVHDLRRTGARNLRRLGIAESVAMKVTGHKTPSIFKRYDITDERDLVEVAALLDKKRRAAENSCAPVENSRAPGFGQTSGRLAPKRVQKAKRGLPVNIPSSLPN